MSWQDLTFSVGGVFFLVSILGMIRSSQKPPRISCFITAFWLWAFVIVYASLGLWFSFGVGILSASGWTLLFFQKRVSDVEYLEYISMSGKVIKGVPFYKVITKKGMVKR